ncbi:Spy/CpxP family protein refolding chaperone [Bermanella sp. R86510]|uniref:Spy/CpxP family protein refolding chaperone n=1 Tax=unclassified Bermanella TaxID=2627862 RepID=UPI0037C812B8
MKLYTILATTILVVISANVIAHGEGPERIAKKLDLNEQQQEQFKALHQKKRDNRESNKQQNLEQKQALKALLSNYSDKKAEQLAQSMAENVKKRSLARFTHMHEIMEILTSEQQERFLELMDKRQHKKEKGRYAGKMEKNERRKHNCHE